MRKISAKPPPRYGPEPNGALGQKTKKRICATFSRYKTHGRISLNFLGGEGEARPQGELEKRRRRSTYIAVCDEDRLKSKVGMEGILDFLHQFWMFGATISGLHDVMFL